MRQLALDLQLADYARFDSYYPGPNDVVVRALREVAISPASQIIWLWGAQGSGRSHLLQAAVAAAADTDQSCAWLPLSDSVEITPAMLDGMGSLGLVCIDDVDAVAGNPAWEQALFRLYEDLREHKGRLLVSASMAPASVDYALRDLASRLASGPTWKLKPLSDVDRLAAVQLRARWRGLDLPEDTGHYLLRRVERGNLALFGMLDELDAAALAAQRKLTIPFVKQVLKLES
jgi:DnaA family protein